MKRKADVTFSEALRDELQNKLLKRKAGVYFEKPIKISCKITLVEAQTLIFETPSKKEGKLKGSLINALPSIN